MRHLVGSFACALLIAAAANASDLNLKVQYFNATTATVFPGTVMRYTVDGELVDAQSQGLAMFCLDLSFSGGPLPQALAPTSAPMNNFATPLGVNNPQGFGGKVTNGVLVQAGGAQNTINNVLAPLPTGTVITGIGLPGNPVRLLTGSVTAPYALGTYTLTPSNLFANVIRLGSTGTPFWKVDPADAGVLTPLTVKVEAIQTNVSSVSVA